MLTIGVGPMQGGRREDAEGLESRVVPNPVLVCFPGITHTMDCVVAQKRASEAGCRERPRKGAVGGEAGDMVHTRRT